MKNQPWPDSVLVRFFFDERPPDVSSGLELGSGSSGVDDRNDSGSPGHRGSREPERLDLLQVDDVDGHVGHLGRGTNLEIRVHC